MDSVEELSKAVEKKLGSELEDHWKEISQKPNQTANIGQASVQEVTDETGNLSKDDSAQVFGFSNDSRTLECSETELS